MNKYQKWCFPQKNYAIGGVKKFDKYKKCAKMYIQSIIGICASVRVYFL